jgi:hypothetical protein
MRELETLDVQEVDVNIARYPMKLPCMGVAGCSIEPTCVLVFNIGHFPICHRCVVEQRTSIRIFNGLIVSGLPAIDILRDMKEYFE